jgi:N-acetylneuraminate synthase
MAWTGLERLFLANENKRFGMIDVILNRIANNEFVLMAEIGVNYYDIAKKENITPMEAAKKMIDEAKRSGIHAVKFQTYKAETLASKDSPSYWDTTEESETSQYSLFKKFDSFGKAEYEELARYCEQIGIEFLSTAFDVESADYLDDLMNVYKISSSDLNNLPFVEYQAKKGKPIILSVGASNKDEIDRTISVIRKYNDKTIVLMHCVLEYPTPYEHANLNKIATLVKEYPGLVIGYSDHTRPDDNYEVLQTAYNLGAKVIEKHFTLDKTLKGNDHYHAMDEKDAKKIIEKIDYLDKIRGSYELKCLESETVARENARRSLVAAKNIKAGDKVTADMLTFKRPGKGITADRYDEVIGKIAVVEIPADTVLKDDMLR